MGPSLSGVLQPAIKSDNPSQVDIEVPLHNLYNIRIRKSLLKLIPLIITAYVNKCIMYFVVLLRGLFHEYTAQFKEALH